jgi:hypothetical protein
MIAGDLIHPSETTHWYDREGKPCYTVIGKNGKERPTTLRDAREHGWLPSVTSIIKCASSFGLERYKLDQMMMSALTLPRKPGSTEEDWLNRVRIDSGEHARKASERGTAIHAAIQDFYETRTIGLAHQYYDHVMAVSRVVDGLPGASWSWEAEQSFGHPLGYGGKTDLSNSAGVIDVKTKEFDESIKLDTYDSHWMQLAAYREGLGMPQARCAICYVSVNNPGLARLIELDEIQLRKGWGMFRGLLEYWKHRANYDPSKVMEVA